MIGILHRMQEEFKASLKDITTAEDSVLPTPATHFFYLLHLQSPHISMQVMARAENTVFLLVEGKETNLEISVCMPSRRKRSLGRCWLCGPDWPVGAMQGGQG